MRVKIDLAVVPQALSRSIFLVSGIVGARPGTDHRMQAFRGAPLGAAWLRAPADQSERCKKVTGAQVGANQTLALDPWHMFDVTLSAIMPTASRG